VPSSEHRRTCRSIRPIRSGCILLERYLLHRLPASAISETGKNAIDEESTQQGKKNEDYSLVGFFGAECSRRSFHGVAALSRRSLQAEQIQFGITTPKRNILVLFLTQFSETVNTYIPIWSGFEAIWQAPCS
jgi:hypothetical protein